MYSVSKYCAISSDSSIRSDHFVIAFAHKSVARERDANELGRIAAANSTSPPPPPRTARDHCPAQLSGLPSHNYVLTTCNIERPVRCGSLPSSPPPPPPPRLLRRYYSLRATRPRSSALYHGAAPPNGMDAVVKSASSKPLQTRESSRRSKDELGRLVVRDARCVINGGHGRGVRFALTMFLYFVKLKPLSGEKRGSSWRHNE
ncbi:unnamed protein product, partial [Iphiclides podalirius]